MDDWIETTTSPDGKHVACFTYHDEIRMGAQFFRLQIDGKNFADRLFGLKHLWSPDSSILVVTEYVSIDRKTARMIVSLLLIRVTDWHSSAFPQLENAFAYPNHFANGTLVLRHTDEFYENGLVRAVRETNLDTMEDWSPLQIADA